MTKIAGNVTKYRLVRNNWIRVLPSIKLRGEDSFNRRPTRKQEEFYISIILDIYKYISNGGFLDDVYGGEVETTELDDAVLLPASLFPSFFGIFISLPEIIRPGNPRFVCNDNSH